MTLDGELRPAVIQGDGLLPVSDDAAERISLGRWPDLPGLEVLSVEHSTRRWRVFHETYSLCAVPRAGNDLAAAGEWVYRRRQHVIRCGGVMLIEPGEVHFNTRVSGRPSYRVFQFDPRLVEEAARELGLRGKPHFRQAQSYDARVLQSFVDLHASLLGHAGSLARDSAFAGCLQVVLRECAETRPAELPEAVHPGVRRARDFLHAHYDANVALHELAAAAALSRFHLLRSFAAAYGLPPHAYQTQVRIARARTLLRRGVPPGEVDVGFADQSHLGRHFRRILGLTPAEYATGAPSRRRR